MRKIISLIAVLATLAVAGIAAAAPGGAEVISQNSCEPSWFGTVCTTVQATTNMTATPSGKFIYATNGTAERVLTFSWGGSYNWSSDIHLVSVQQDGELQTSSERSSSDDLVPFGHLRARLRREPLVPLRERLDPVHRLLVRLHHPVTLVAWASPQHSGEARDSKGDVSVSDERGERLRRGFGRRPSQLGDELDARGGERIGHRLLEEQPAKPAERGPLEPWFALLAVQHDEREGVLERHLGHLAAASSALMRLRRSIARRNRVAGDPCAVTNTCSHREVSRSCTDGGPA